jgi:hypothetical protein
MTDKERIKAIIQQYADKGKNKYSETNDSRGSCYNAGFWDGYECCAKGLLRELEDMQEEPKPKFKIGDTIIHVDDGTDIIYKEHKVINVLDLGYILDNGHSIEIADQDDWLIVRRCSVDEAMVEVEEKAKAFTEAHKGEDSEKILADMRGEESISDELDTAAKESSRIERFDDTEVGYDLNKYSGFVEGALWKEQQMMKDAVTAEVRMVEDFMGTTTFRCVCNKYKIGDKVKILVIKE